jgi:hypothetical protein
MANTFELIASSTVGSGGASSIDFTSIPSTYTDLCIKVSARTSTGNGTCAITFNGSTSGYSYKYLYGNGSTTNNGSSSSATSIDSGVYNYLGSTANTFANAELYIPNYSGSSNKSVSLDTVNENNATEAYAWLEAALWSNSAAINRVTITAPATFTFVQYSTAYLYGVKNA